jgi:hypothetical protein
MLHERASRVWFMTKLDTLSTSSANDCQNLLVGNKKYARFVTQPNNA